MEQQAAIDLAERWFRNNLANAGTLNSSARLDENGHWCVEIESAELTEGVVVRIYSDGKLGDETMYLEVLNRN